MDKRTTVILLAVAVIAAAGALFFLAQDPDVTYELNGGTNPDGNRSSYNNAAVFLEDPFRNGYSFGGWYTDNEFSVPVESLSPDAGKVKVYAKWTPVTYTVSYVLNGGTVAGNPGTFTVEDDTTLKEPVMFLRAFSGWYTDPSLSDDSRVSGLKGIASDITLYAGWNTMIGRSYTHSVEGTVSIGGQAVNITGEATLRYADMDGDRYLTVEDTYFEMMDGYNEKNHSVTSKWRENGALEGMTCSGTAVIDTMYGLKETYVYENGLTKDYYGKDWTPYRSDMTVTIGGSSLTLRSELISQNTFTPKDDYTVTVLHGDGISKITGEGTYPSGSEVTLTASAVSGRTFDGWYLDNRNEVTAGGEIFRLDAIGCDITLYALCDDDVIFGYPADTADPEWVIEDGFTGKRITSAYTNPAMVSLPDNGYYSATLTFTGADGKTCVFETRVTTGDLFAETYDWIYGGREYSITWTDHYDRYVQYRNLETENRHRMPFVSDSRFVTYEDPAIVRIADSLSELSKDMSYKNRADFVLSFVQQSVGYQYDKEWIGTEEYWKYPYETLFDGKGDCEDSAMLYAAVMKAMGYDVALILYTDHMATGIGMLENTSGTYFMKNGIRYYYCETTGVGWKLGQIPDGRDTAQIVVV